MTPTRYDTSLLIGATGMLARVLAEVAARSTRTVAVARHASHSLAAAPAEMGILPVDLDWRDTDAFVEPELIHAIGHDRGGTFNVAGGAFN